MLCAADGMGCWWNGRRARVSERESLERGIVAFTDAKSLETYGRGKEWSRIRRAAGACRGWSDAYGHALVATGRAELMLDARLNPWDCAPFVPILREAGGYFGDWSGNETIYANEAMSTTQTLLPEVMRLIDGD
jgi:myo-inositol-1(or 4)-monophosphatase